jgi:hypothetical protein
VPELGCDLHFVQKLLVAGVIVGFRNFQRDLYFLNRILSSVNIRQWPGCDASENSVFTESLACL